MEIHYTHNCLITSELESYSAWPDFKPIKSEKLGGLWRTLNLREALTLDDLSCAAWRAQIPFEILLSLQKFTVCHAELIEMAQAVPEIYLKMAKWNPALTLVAATYWTFRSSGDAPSIRDRVMYWENLYPEDILQHTRFNESKSFMRALSKTPAEDCTHYLLRSLRDQWEVPKKRRLLQHLKQIKTENIWLLSCYPANLDPSIHVLAAEAPSFEEYKIVEVICDLSNRRELKGWDGWPYRNRIHTWPQLLGAYNRFFKKINHVQEVLPGPPFECIEEEGFHIVPLKSHTALRCESSAMTNCVEGFITKIHSRKAYAYKLLIPERATVLIKRDFDLWSIDEAMTEGNEREVLPGTWLKLRKWLRENSKLKNS